MRSLLAGLAVLPLALAVPVAGAAATDARTPSPPHVLLIAVGDEQPVFDRFVGDLARRLEGLDVASIATASASGRVGRKLDTPADVYAAIRGLRAGRPGGCLVYLTGHGTRAGLSMPLAAPAPARRYAALKASDVQAALQQGCAGVPTVLVASACYSGVYLQRGLAGAERIVLTAAAADRTSFGCSNDRTHTYYDGCFLRSLEAATTWRQLAARTSACVARLERTLLPGRPPSNPQAFFGRRVRDLPLASTRRRK
jgi:hypothetical protein